MTSRKILGRLVKGTIGFGSGTVILGTSVLNVTYETNIADLSAPVLGDARQAISSIPFSEMLFGGLKIINAGRSAYMGYKSSDPVLITKNYINAIFELLSGSALLTSFLVYELYAIKTSTVFHSIAFSYIGFSVSAFIDLIGSIEKFYHVFPSRNSILEVRPHNPKNFADESMTEKITNKYIEEYHNAMMDCLVNLLKFIGWTILTCGSILSVGSVLTTVGWALVGAATLLQLCRIVYGASVFGVGLFKPASSSKTPKLSSVTDTSEPLELDMTEISGVGTPPPELANGYN